MQEGVATKSPAKPQKHEGQPGEPIQQARSARVCYPAGPPYACSKCGRTFRQSGNLTKHMRSHETEHLRWNRNTSEKPFKCTFPGCKKSFTAKSTLQQHMKVHPNGNFAADIADGKSTTPIKSTMQSDDPPTVYKYRCLHLGCEKHFETLSELRAHTALYAPDIIAEREILMESLSQLLNLLDYIARRDDNFAWNLYSTIDIVSIHEALNVLINEDLSLVSVSTGSSNDISCPPPTTHVPSHAGWYGHLIHRAPNTNACPSPAPQTGRAGTNKRKRIWDPKEVPNVANAAATVSMEQFREDFIESGQVGVVDSITELSDATAETSGMNLAMFKNAMNEIQRKLSHASTLAASV